METEDGITRNAVFCMRDLLRIYPQLMAEGHDHLPFDDFIDVFASSYAMDEDLEKTPYKSRQAKDWQDIYQKLAHRVFPAI